MLKVEIQLQIIVISVGVFQRFGEDMKRHINPISFSK